MYYINLLNKISMKKLTLILLIAFSLVSCSKENIENEIVFKNNLPNVVYNYTDSETHIVYFFFNNTTILEWSIYNINTSSDSEFRGEYTYDKSTRTGTIITENNENVPFYMIGEDVNINGIFYTPN